MAYEVVMSYHLHMPSYFLGTFTEYPYVICPPTSYPGKLAIVMLVYSYDGKQYITG